jgi:hypothetical protein
MFVTVTAAAWARAVRPVFTTPPVVAFAQMMHDNVLYHSLCAAKNKSNADVISPTAYQTDGAKN